MVFDQIHEIVFHGKGGYDWNTVYNMPIWLRRFTFHKMKKFYEDENEAIEKQNKQLENKTNQSSKPLTPNVSKPTYSTKAPKK
jgi:hypothetical protein